MAQIRRQAPLNSRFCCLKLKNGFRLDGLDDAFSKTIFILDERGLAEAVLTTSFKGSVGQC